jgi:hypothetical protein
VKNPEAGFKVNEAVFFGKSGEKEVGSCPNAGAFGPREFGISFVGPVNLSSGGEEITGSASTVISFSCDVQRDLSSARHVGQLAPA